MQPPRLAAFGTMSDYWAAVVEYEKACGGIKWPPIEEPQEAPDPHGLGGSWLERARHNLKVMEGR